MAIELLRGRENIKGNEHFFREHNNIIFSAVKGCPKTTVVSGNCLLFLPPSQNQKTNISKDSGQIVTIAYQFCCGLFICFLNISIDCLKVYLCRLNILNFLASQYHHGPSASLHPLDIFMVPQLHYDASIAFIILVASSYYCNLPYYCSLMHHFGQTFLFFWGADSSLSTLLPLFDIIIVLTF